MADENAVKVEVRKEQVPAQVAPPREPDADTVDVHEVSVSLDEQVLDPTDENAVIVPPEGRGSLDLPIHSVVDPETGEAAQTPNEALADTSESEPSDEEREEAAREGRTPESDS